MHLASSTKHCSYAFIIHEKLSTDAHKKPDLRDVKKLMREKGRKTGIATCPWNLTSCDLWGI